MAVRARNPRSWGGAGGVNKAQSPAAAGVSAHFRRTREERRSQVRHTSLHWTLPLQLCWVRLPGNPDSDPGHHGGSDRDEENQGCTWKPNNEKGKQSQPQKLLPIPRGGNLTFPLIQTWNAFSTRLPKPSEAKGIAISKSSSLHTDGVPQGTQA